MAATTGYGAVRQWGKNAQANADATRTAAQAEATKAQAQAEAAESYARVREAMK